jgi:hypothetical protein
VFLNGDNLCSLHAKRGEDAKPDVCRLFPYLFTDTPGGVVVGYSFVCRTVRENLSPDVHAPDSELLDLYQRSEGETRVHRRKVESPILYHDSHQIDWESYLLIEGLAAELLAEKQLALPRRLVALDVMAGLLDSYLKLRGGDDAQTNTAVVESFIEQMKAEDKGTILRLARIPLPSAMIYRTISASLLMLNPGGKPSRWRAGGQWVKGLLRQLPPAGSEPDWGVEETAIAQRYLTHVLLRKDLLCGNALHILGGVRRGIIVLALLFSLIRHFRMELRTQWGTIDAVNEAIMRVERGFGPHARFREDGIPARGRTLHLLWDMADNIMGRKRFVPSMVLPR